MHRSWLAVAAFTLLGCFRPGDGAKGPADAGTDAHAEDAGSGSTHCGDGVLDPAEQCETMPLNLNGESCASATLGEAPEGALGCNANCTFNVINCRGFGAGGVSGNGGVGGVGGVGGGL